MTKHEEDILLRINYIARSKLEAHAYLKNFTEELVKFVNIKSCSKPSLYWKDNRQYQVLYKIYKPDKDNGFLKIRDNISRDWDMSQDNEAIWNAIETKKQGNFLHPSVKWAHLEMVVYD